MLFLISQKQKEKILDEYYSYLIKIFNISLIVLIVIFVTVIFPTYLNMKVDKDILKDKIEPLRSEIEKSKTENVKKDVSDINKDISLLGLKVRNDTLDIYRDIRSIYKEIPNVEILSISVDSLNKKVLISASIDNRNTANAIVERLNSSKYKGADLPYSVFSQNKNFIFNQSLNYE